MEEAARATKPLLCTLSTTCSHNFFLFRKKKEQNVLFEQFDNRTLVLQKNLVVAPHLSPKL